MSNETLTILCTNTDCAQLLRIPSDRTRLLVTCPKCWTKWLWMANENMPDDGIAAEDHVQPHRDRKPIFIVLALVTLVLIAGVWTQAWLPTSLFAVATFIAWRLRRKLSESTATNLWEKAAGVLYEATAGLSCAIAVGLAFVIGLATFLNLYPNISPTNYPAWLVKLDDFLIKFSAWNQSSNNRVRMTVVYLSLIALCFVLSLVARRYKKEWRPVRQLTGFKQTVNKVLLAIQVVALFSLFSQAAVNQHVEKLAQQTSWRYSVAKRAEQKFEARRLIAEELTKAARDQKDVDQDEKSDFAQSISYLGDKLPHSQLSAQPYPSPSPSPNISPSGYPSWRPPNWPRPPDTVINKIQTNTPLKTNDYEPAPRVWKHFKAIDKAVVADTNQFVANQIDVVIPPHTSVLPDPIPSDPKAASVFPPKTSDQWKVARALLAEQELKADVAERRCGEATQMFLEAISEYLSMNIASDPIFGTWVDLALNAISDRVYGDLFSKDSARFVKVTERLKSLFTPRETKAARLKEQIDAHLAALNYDAAEPLISELQKYPKTKTGKSWAILAEEVSFEKVARSLTSLKAPDETIDTASEYLSHHARAERAGQVRGWLASANREKTRLEIEASKPQMLVYVRDSCSMSQYFLETTSHDGEVIAQKGRFRYELLDVDATPPTVSIPEDAFLPIVVFKDRYGRVLDVVTGRTALIPTSLTMHMRAIAAGRPVRTGVFEGRAPESCPIPGLNPRSLFHF